jgi:SHS2 domain-containing protein
MHKYLDHKADIKVLLECDSLDNLFEEYIDIIQENLFKEPKFEDNKIKEASIELKAESIEKLLHKYLEEIIFLNITEEQVILETSIFFEKDENYNLKLEYKYVKSKDLKLEIKGVSFQDFYLKEEKSKFISQVIFDI